MVDMVDMDLDTVLTPLDMVMVEDMATQPLVMDLDIPGLDMESVPLMPSQRLMLSMELMAMVDMVLDTVLTLLDMVMVLGMATQPLVMAMDMVLDIPGLDMENVPLMPSQRLMLSMELMDMVDMDLDTVLTPLDMVMVLDMATQPLVMAMDMVLDIPGLDMESVLPMPSQRLMLSMALMVMV